jgi:hypothetical protein
VHTSDLINGLFEAFGGIMIWLNVRRIIKDKQVRGMSSVTTWVFTAWGFWNLYFYPHLGQWLSFAGGLVIVSGNFAWCVLAWRYRNA